MVVQGQPVMMAEINFLCSHKKLREKRIAPVLIREITRRVNVQNIWQAVYTAGKTLPTPFGTAQYWHRNLNPKKLIEVGFSYLPANKNMGQIVKLAKIKAEPFLQGFREMQQQDLAQVTELLNNHLNEYKVHITFNQQEVAHFLIPQEGVVHTYVVDEKGDGNITDFCSFYALPSQVIKWMPDNEEQRKQFLEDKGAVIVNKHNNELKPGYDTINAAYCFYNVTMNNEEERQKLLFKSMLGQAYAKGFDVFNMVEVLQNRRVATDLLFKAGSGRLAHYLYNWRLPQLDAPDIGIVLV